VKKKINSYLIVLFACATLGVVMSMLEEGMSHPPKDVVQMLNQQTEANHAR
jgi:hypothetical protein